MNEEFLQTLNERLLNDDVIAPAQFAEAALNLLLPTLERKWPKLSDESVLIEAANDAILFHIKNPQKYDPTKASVSGYLTMIADRDLKNSLAKRKRQKKREMAIDDVELLKFPGNKDYESEILSRTQVEELMPKIKEAFPDPVDQQLLELVINRVRETAEYAKVLAIENSPVEEQRREVKKAKDRIKKRLSRLGESLP